MVQFDERSLEALCRQHDVRRLRIFGSAARGEERPGSDVDLLVEFTMPKDLFDLIDLEERLSDLFRRPVDLLTEGEISPYLRDSILSSVSVLYDRSG